MKKNFTFAGLFVIAPVVGAIAHYIKGPFISVGNDSTEHALLVGSLGWSLLGALLMLTGKFSIRKAIILPLVFSAPATITILFGEVILSRLADLHRPTLPPIMSAPDNK